MNPIIAASIAQGLAALLEIWRANAGHPVGWEPSDEDWDAMLKLNEKTAADYKREAGVTPDVPNAPVG